MNQISIAGMIDFPIFYQGIKFLCEEIDNVHFKGNYTDSHIRDILDQEQINLLFMKRNNGSLIVKDTDIIKECKSSGTYPVVFLDRAEENTVRKYFEAGYKGIISSDVDAYELELSIRTIVNGGFYVSQDLSSDLFDAIVNPKKLQRRVAMENSRLTRRETEVMQLICLELTNQKIAARLKISPRTVEVHRLNIIRKLGVKNSIGIVKFAVRNEMVVIR